tara:strand:- start:331 stop:1377 length:1047 start_codon:yes stop_codon:yes gene_type:complete
MSKKLTLDIDTSQQQITESIDFSSVEVDKKQQIAKLKDETKAVYVPVRKDFVKVDRWVIDLVIPFLNSHTSAGVSVLYLDLYRMTYGYGKNNVKLTDEIIEQRLAIPKRTIMSYKKELIKYDLLQYKAGNRKTRGEFIIKRPEQSIYFEEYIHKTAQSHSKNVGNTEKNNTIYNIDNMYIDSETLVRKFYKDAGWKETSISREHIDKGTKVLNALHNKKYDKDFISGLCDWSIKFCNSNNKPIYGIGFITHLLPQYVEEIEKKKRTAAQMKKVQDEMKELNDEMDRQDSLMNKYSSLPKHIKSLIMTEAKEMLETMIADKKIGKMTDTAEKFIIDANVVEIMERDYSV